MSAVPETHQDLDGRGFAPVATLGPKQLHVSPTWYLWDAVQQQLFVSSITGRLKYRNLERDPCVEVCIPDMENPYRSLEIRGAVQSMDRDENHTLINALAKKYIGKDEYPAHMPGDVRVVARIEPERVVCFAL